MRQYFYKYIFQFISIGLILLLGSCMNETRDDYSQSRTVLVYINADNSLAGYTYDNIDQLYKGYEKVKGSLGNLLVYADYKDRAPELYQIVKEKNKVIKRLIKSYNEQNSVSGLVMGNVFSEVYDKFSASSYGLILAFHGAGWLPETSNTFIANTNKREEYPTRSNSPDNENYLDIRALSETLDHAPYQDFIVFDACLMGSAEVAYELKGKANYIIASPTEVHAKGFPYDKLIKELFRPGKPDYKRICDDYVSYYKNNIKEDAPLQTATLSVVNLKYIDDFKLFVKDMTSKYLNSYNNINALKIQPFDRMTHKIFFDSRDLLSQLPLNKEEVQKMDELLSDLVPHKHATSYFINLPIEKFSGISLGYENYLMKDLKPSYQSLKWNKKTG